MARHSGPRSRRQAHPMRRVRSLLFSFLRVAGSRPHYSHFEGSSILYWDRLNEPPPPADDLPTTPTPVSGLILTADTIMVQPTQKQFTFIWSAPNMIPLNPTDVLGIWHRVKGLAFSQASSTWPGRFLRQDAKAVLEESVRMYLEKMGWVWDGDQSFEPMH